MSRVVCGPENRQSRIVISIDVGAIHGQSGEDLGETHNGLEVPNEYSDALLYGPSVYLQTNWL